MQVGIIKSIKTCFYKFVGTLFTGPETFIIMKGIGLVLIVTFFQMFHMNNGHLVIVQSKNKKLRCKHDVSMVLANGPAHNSAHNRNNIIEKQDLVN